MSSKQTDNSRYAEKLKLRDIVSKENDKVLDCFHGNGKIWRQINTIKNVNVIGIEKDRDKGDASTIYGLAEKVIPSLDLSKFNIIDFDAYGSPYKSLKQIFDNKTLKEGTYILYTFILTGMGTADKLLLKEIGINSNMYKQCRLIYKKYSFIAFKHFLYKNGVRSIYNYHFIDSHSNKNYGYFVVE